MRLLTAIALGMLLALPVFAAEFVALTGQTSPPPPPVVGDTPCTSSQGAVIDASLGLQGGDADFDCCLPGNPGEPGNMNGFAFALVSCQDGWVNQSNLQVNVGDGGEPYHAYVWRDLGGIPFDACGMECAIDCDRTVAGVPPVWEVIDWTGAACPCVTFNGEILYVGVTYGHITTPPDFFIGRQNTPGNVGTGYGNLSGNHGEWDDLNDFGFGNLWGAENVIDIECGGVPVEPSSWGAMKNLYR